MWFLTEVLLLHLIRQKSTKNRKLARKLFCWGSYTTFAQLYISSPRLNLIQCSPPWCSQLVWKQRNRWKSKRHLATICWKSVDKQKLNQRQKFWKKKSFTSENEFNFTYWTYWRLKFCDQLFHQADKGIRVLINRYWTNENLILDRNVIFNCDIKLVALHILDYVCSFNDMALQAFKKLANQRRDFQKCKLKLKLRFSEKVTQIWRNLHPFFDTTK